MSELYYTRNPYPVPDVSCEGTWVGKPVLGDKVSPKDEDWGAKLKAHERLFAHHTLNSIRRDRRLVRPKVPKDSLDFALSTVYVHNEDSFVSKAYAIMQPEALGRETWRTLRNEIKVRPKSSLHNVEEEDTLKYIYGGIQPADPVAFLKTKSHCYRGPVAERRNHPSGVKLNIDGPHTVQSNPGYSRKIDGTYYGI